MLDSGFVYSEKLWSPPPPRPTPPPPHAALSPCSHTRHQPLPLLWRSDLVEPECESTLLTPESLDTHNNSSYMWQYHTLCYQRRVSRHTSCFHLRPEARELETTLPAVSRDNWNQTKTTFQILPHISWIRRRSCVIAFKFEWGTLLCGQNHAPCFSLLI